MEAVDAKEALRAWVLQRGNVDEQSLTDDSMLVESGIINSLDVIELIPELETLRGRPVDTQTLSGEEFRSINTLVSSFFKDAT